MDRDGSWWFVILMDASSNKYVRLWHDKFENKHAYLWSRRCHASTRSWRQRRTRKCAFKLGWHRCSKSSRQTKIAIVRILEAKEPREPQTTQGLVCYEPQINRKIEIPGIFEIVHINPFVPFESLRINIIGWADCAYKPAIASSAYLHENGTNSDRNSFYRPPYISFLAFTRDRS